MLVPEDKILSARILAIDDNPVNVALLHDMLESEGFTGVVTETNPLRGLDLLRYEDFNLLLLDIRMPGLDGHQLMERLPDSVRLCLPVIVLTAQTDAETRMKALAGGARDFITKPFDLTEVVHRIRNTLEAQLLYAERRDQAEALQQEVALRTAELAYQAAHDPSTDLPNRSGLRHELGRRLLAREHGAVLFVSVEGLGAVNDSLGHSVGEALLHAVGERLVKAFPRPAVVGYWGGGEMVVLIPETNLAASVARAEAIFASSFLVAGNELVVHCTVGCSLFPVDGLSEDVLVRRAGMARFFAHQRGLSFCQFTPDLEEAAQRRRMMERELRGAIDRGEMELYYQPKVALPGGEAVGMEALLRWHHPDLGFVSPAHFIPVAEETGAIVRIGQWVMEQACRDTARWREMGYSSLRVAVNVSGRQLEAIDLAGMVAQALALADLPPENLEIEITETALMRDLDRARRVLATLREAGVHLAIDDFGTGYSSLAYLRALSIDTLKIDQSFVRDLGDSIDDQVIVKTIIAMAHSLGLGIVAEGIEELGQVTFLHGLGCALGQGYYYARPMPADDFERYLKKTAEAVPEGVL